MLSLQHPLARITIIILQLASCHKLLKPSPYYVMIESTLQFDDVGVVPGLLPLLWVVQRVMKMEWETAWEGGYCTRRLCRT